ncbi:DUF2871 family protein [Trueperella pyogenes]|uniref:DUF2871 family protein n=1 Tax=Trueperella pyogenes TaxID=1661 RepID=UPI000D52B6DF|nr:DUF2871 family protein [Trueperella pyogenes]AWG03722.1 hypothetical protein DC090_04400 [Trueperella pyogenes]AWG16453.1 hypothetical protein DDE06_06330 [Trueperella pyogenes]AZR05333.1 DUF2871 domain-containing protein [Trueperella pyogenes]MBB3025730.1 hypothetical protein [Trueperella pyogenes]MCI7689769.1 DUF2871 domain-containing protein [Trueperella pyogenes]
MKNLWLLAATYAGLGLLAGFFYRMMTMNMEVVPATQLSAVHTHLLALGMMVMLIVLALDAVLKISGTRSFTIFCWTYNAGVLITAGVMVWHGLIQLDGGQGGGAVAGIAGIGHILLTVGLISLFVSLSAPVKRAAERAYRP